MVKHKFFKDFQPAPLASFFAINERLSRRAAKDKSRPPKVATPNKKPASTKKAA